MSSPNNNPSNEQPIFPKVYSQGELENLRTIFLAVTSNEETITEAERIQRMSDINEEYDRLYPTLPSQEN